MRFEIERRFTVRNDGWRSMASSSAKLRDGVLHQDERGKLRVRTDGTRAWLCSKGARDGITRTEREVEISLERAEVMIREDCVGRVVEKTRHFVPVDGANWVVDAFLGKLEGLVWSEIELESEDQVLVRPHWLNREISDDRRFRQSNLIELSHAGAEAVTLKRILAV